MQKPLKLPQKFPQRSTPLENEELDLQLSYVKPVGLEIPHGMDVVGPARFFITNFILKEVSAENHMKFRKEKCETLHKVALDIIYVAPKLAVS